VRLMMMPQPVTRSSGIAAVMVRSYRTLLNKSGVWGAWGVDVTKNG
jgi:hypothetical protein